MSCNGCRVLRKGCSEACVLRPCLQWIDTADAQGHATVFVAKFFGRAGLLSFISAVPDAQRPAACLICKADHVALPSILCVRSVVPVAAAAVDTVLRGGAIGPLPDLGGGCGAGTGSGDLYGPAGAGVGGKRAGGWSTFSTAKRVVRKAEAASCDLGLCLSPGSPPATGDRRAPLLRPGTPSMSSDESVTTTTTGSGDREPVLLNLFP
ncbi:hypothetical protein HU200_018383 [Digitaria exilis]|uniref:LOB domain-containing protein n=1 Tax=Digitaria exilis TaxID=1010633 RepID=A0A835F4T3_9POAL|nr:hypothetical protein HU200_018383 [Digitaria exilis]